MHEAQSPPPAFPAPHLTAGCAYHVSPWWMEKFRAFLLLQRFLPGIQNHRSSRRKQVTGPPLPPELGCPNFPQNVAQGRVRGAQSSGRKEGVPGTPRVLATAQGCSRARASYSGQVSPSLNHRHTSGTRLRTSVGLARALTAQAALQALLFIGRCPQGLPDPDSPLGPGRADSDHLDFPGVLSFRQCASE